jgi:hypothetical protein
MWTRILLTAFLSSAADARAGEPEALPVAHTSWQLLRPAEWDERSRGLMRELAGRLPAAYRHPGHAVRFTLEPSRSVDVDGGHTLAEVSSDRRRVRLYLAGLRERLAERVGERWQQEAQLGVAADYLFKRTVIHELTHVWDKGRRVSSTGEWRTISGWSLISLMPSLLPGAEADGFAAPYGATSPAEDLATFAEVYFAAPRLGPTEADAHPRCRFPAKFRYFSEKHPDVPEPGRNVSCASPSEVGLSADKVRSVEVVWASPTLSSVAALGGHLLLMLELDTGNGARRETFALLAETGDLPPGSATYVAMGLAGGFPSRIVRDGYEATAFRYQQEEGRDVRRFRWNLTEEQKARLLARLDELQMQWRRPYYFFQRNCTELIIQLADAVEPGALSLPPVIPPDLVLAQLMRRGWLTAVPLDAERDLAPQTRARLLASMRSRALNGLCGQRFARAKSSRNEVRERGWRELFWHVRAVDDLACWHELSWLVALSAPLEASLKDRANGGSELAGFTEAAIAVRQNVAPGIRAAHHVALRRDLQALAVAEEVVGRDAEHTPYVPVAMGLETSFGPRAGQRLFFRREAIRLERGQRRLFPPAPGVDVTALGFRAALQLKHRQLYPVLSYDLLRLRYLPERFTHGPSLGLEVRVLNGEHHFRERVGDVRWAEAALAVGLVRNRTRSVLLDASFGLAGRTRYGGETTLHLEGPLRARLAWHPAGPIRAGMVWQAAWLPSVSRQGPAASGAEAELEAWLFLGRLREVGLKLELQSRVRRSGSGRDADDARVALGLRAERY